MARMIENTEGADGADNHTVDALMQGDRILLPDDGFIANAEILRNGQDLVLRHPDGRVFTVENYFSAMPAPALVNSAGAALQPDMVRAFVQPANQQQQYAQAHESLNDESAIGIISEVSGTGTITRTNGIVEKIVQGLPVFAGDIIETDVEGAVNIMFVDETSFAVSNNARLAIDEYVFDPASGAGTQSFSVLRGMFVFVSGMIGREDPDDVEISTPIGNIGIRGTTIAGNVDTGEITVVEGAIVLRSLDGAKEATLATQFETARLGAGGEIEYLGVMDGAQIAGQFSSMQQVAGAFFSGIAQGTAQTPAAENNTAPAETTPAPAETAPEIVPPGGYNETSFDGNGNAGFGPAAAPSQNHGADGVVPLPAAPVQDAAPAPAPAGGGMAGDSAAYTPPAQNYDTAPPATNPGNNSGGGGTVTQPPGSNPVNVEITTPGTYAGTDHNDSFTLMTANFGNISGGDGYDRIILPDNFPGYFISLTAANTGGIEELDTNNNTANVITINFSEPMVAGNAGNHFLVHMDGQDSLNLDLNGTAQYRVAAIDSGSIVFSNGNATITIENFNADLFGVQGATWLRAGEVLANGWTFESYDEIGTMNFIDANMVTHQYRGPVFNNVKVGTAGDDSADVFDVQDVYMALRDGNDTLQINDFDTANSYLDGGNGVDELLLSNNDLIDLSLLGTDNFQNFERITFLSPSPDTQVIRLSMDQIFQLMEQSELSNSLFIGENSSGAIGPMRLEITNVDGLLTDLGATTMETVGTNVEYAFDMGSGNTYTLLVSENVTVNVVP